MFWSWIRGNWIKWFWMGGGAFLAAFFLPAATFFGAAACFVLVWLVNGAFFNQRDMVAEDSYSKEGSKELINLDDSSQERISNELEMRLCRFAFGAVCVPGAAFAYNIIILLLCRTTRMISPHLISGETGLRSRQNQI